MSRTSRRAFLEQSMLAAAAIATPPIVQSAMATLGPTRKATLRLAVIGVRGRGRTVDLDAAARCGVLARGLATLDGGARSGLKRRSKRRKDRQPV